MKRYAARLFAVLLVFVLSGQAVVAADAPAQRIYAVTVNGATVTSGTVLLESADGTLLASEEDLRAWGFELAGRTPTIVFEKQAFFALRDFEGLSVTIVTATQTLAIRAPASLFVPAAIALKETKNGRPVFDGTRGAYMNYDFDAQSLDGRSSLSSLYDIAYTGLPGGGVITNTFTMLSGTGQSASYGRLGTTYRIDNLPAVATLRIGDAATSEGVLGASAPFFGIQRQTDFSTNPNMITIPTFGVRGVSLSQSTVDVYVNGMQAAHQSVNSGPFTISNLPTIDGQGNVTVVVRDILGREHVVVTPIYFARSLLKPGLTSTSFEAGIVRRDYGNGWGEYSGGIASGTYRRGVTDHLTGEAHAEAGNGVVLGELAADVAVNRVGIFHLAGAMSRTGGVNGSRGMLGYDFNNAGNGFGAFATADAQTSAFASAGQAGLGGLVTLTAGLKMRIGRLGSISAALVDRRAEEAKTTTALSVGYSQPLANGFLTGSLTRSLRTGAMGAAFFFSGLVRGRHGVDAQSSYGSSGNTQRIVYHENLPQEGFGSGYDIGVARSPQTQLDATLYEHTKAGDGVLEILTGGSGSSAYQARWHGAIAYLDHSLHVTRSVSGSYGLISIPGFPNVRVYEGALLIGKTNAQGNLFVSDFAPYVDNYVTLDARDVPLSVNVDTLTAKVVPYARNAAIVRFRFKRDGGVVIKAVDDAGAPLPFGTALRSADGASWAVARDGVAYLSGAPSGPLMLSAGAGTGACRMLVAVPRDTSDIPDLGSQTCARGGGTALTGTAQRDGAARSNH